MSSTHPTIVFFAGGFADPTCFDTISALFQQSGYPAVYANVRSLNPSDAASVTTAKDAEHTRNQVLLPLIEEGKDVIVFVHSYGGIVGGAAAARLSKKSRLAEGKAGGVVGLVYLAGNIVREGESLLQAMGGSYPPFLKENCPSQGLAIIEPVMETLYNDVADPSFKSKAEAAMLPHALAAFETPATAPAWAEPELEGRRLYIRTLEDQCIPSFVQDIWINKTKVKWNVVDLKTSHCPFVSCPEEVVNIVLEFIKDWN
ncbi:alpha/beta-hydrolase [Delitschia confertaspora ATCC 74209]|uniref:Alpha/beta-hydrolase n=1 Tax=Delitschia confertaspora ATCC 74209 TaxID=1513339 RepID=A0A9P4JJ39_9PLEO|nr:alpha/beta-hydrolase [Delitschia confertaspora ATCC 74209]